MKGLWQLYPYLFRQKKILAFDTKKNKFNFCTSISMNRQQVIWLQHGLMSTTFKGNNKSITALERYRDYTREFVTLRDLQVATKSK
jgi:hypothetical protein